jgi:predicted alpha/beta-hydrolase family hydrolase
MSDYAPNKGHANIAARGRRQPNLQARSPVHPMNASPAEPITIAVDAAQRVSGLLLAPPRARACCVLAHGAGAGMAHPFMAAVATALAARSIATLRYQFPYMEQGGRRPDPPKLAQATVRAAAAAAANLLPALPFVAGGKSFGGRMTSQAQAAAPLPGVRGLVFLGFPLHPAGRPSDARAAHLFDVQVPMLFLQGSRDALADLALLRPVIERLGARASLRVVQDADHSFHVPARSGRNDTAVRGEMLDALAEWTGSVIAR